MRGVAFNGHSVAELLGNTGSEFLAAPNKPKWPDYRPETTEPKLSTQTYPSGEGSTLSVQNITGTIALMPDRQRHNIEAATLVLSYWPDRNNPSAYAELIMMETN